MKKISNNLYLACDYYFYSPQHSLQMIAEKFQVDRHSITKHLSDYEEYYFEKDDFHYLLTEEEKAPVEYFLLHKK